MTERARPSMSTVLLGGACAALAVIVVLLVQQNAALRRRLESAIQTRGGESLPNGERLASLPNFVGAAGEPAGLPASPLDFADGRAATVVFVFSGSCDVCESSLPFVERLAAAGAASATWVVALQTDAKTPADLKYLGRGFGVCGVPDVGKTWVRRIDAVPAFLLVDSSGTLRASYWALLGEERQAELLRAVEAGAKGWTSAPH